MHELESRDPEPKAGPHRSIWFSISNLFSWVIKRPSQKMLKSSLNSLPHLNAVCTAVDGGVLWAHWLCAYDNMVRTDNTQHKKAELLLDFPAVSCQFGFRLSWPTFLHVNSWLVLGVLRWQYSALAFRVTLHFPGFTNIYACCDIY